MENVAEKAFFDGKRPRRHSSILGSNSAASLELIKEQYDSIKDELRDMLVDSRCALFGFSKAAEIFEPREILSYSSLEDSEEFENDVRELIRSIYFVLESRRLDLSYEKMDVPPCPTLQEEEKYRIGVENKTSKLYKKKCIGRLRKQVADYTLLTGLPTLALDAYSAAIEFLKATNDWLWLAAAFEGWGCAATVLKYNETEERLRKQSGLQRVSSMTPVQMRDYQDKVSQHHLGVSIGHQRYRSDDDQLRLASAAASAAQLNELETQQKKVFKRPWQLLNLEWSQLAKSPLDHEEIVERFKTALENYEKYSFAVMIEYECMIRASSVFKHQRLFVETEAFLRDHVGKFLDDSFTLFNNIMKGQICMACAAIYKEIGFQRKNSFFSRLAVLFRLHVTEDESRTEADYRLVYPVLYRTLSGYGINDNGKDAPLNGPIAVQVKALHES
uniref:KIF-binding protein n=1 Tax=Acrobeloides nanus TaxID=290746 RepID=A0A914EKI2_9BILA